MANTRSPLLTGVTDKILTREKNIIPTSYAVGKTFTGAQLDDSVYLDTFVKPGIWRISNNIAQNSDNKLPIDNIEGFLQVLEINHDEDTSDLNGATRIRQIVFPDHLEESSPYTRVGQAAVTGGDITWSEWGMMGGGSLRRVIMTQDITAKNNVLYESFGPYTLTLPDPENVPVGTQIGLEQYVGVGYVVCGDLKQVTEPSVERVADYSVSPISVGLWTQNPYGFVNELDTVFNVPIELTNPQDDARVIEVINTDSTSLPENTNLNTIVGIYTQIDNPVSNISKGAVFKKNDAAVYLYYDIHRENWIFADSYTTLQNVVYFEGEYNLQVKDATVYIFECTLTDTNTRVWELDVDHNYARAVNILSTRIHDVDTRVEHVKACHLPTYGRKHIYHSTYLNISANTDYNVTDEELEQNEELFKAAVAATNDVRFYDHTVVIPTSDTRTEAYLPDATLSPIGTKITFELMVAAGKTRECTIYDKLNGANNNSQKFAVAGEGGIQTLTIPFQCEKRGSGNNEWVLLTVGGNTAVPKTISSTGDVILEDQPVGSFRWWFGKDDMIPDGWLICNGQTFESSDYPELYDTLGVNIVPNLIDKFITGIDGESGTGTTFTLSTSSTAKNATATPIIKAKPTLYSAAKMGSHVGMIFACAALDEFIPEGSVPLLGTLITCSKTLHPEFFDYVLNKLPADAKLPIGTRDDAADPEGVTWWARNNHYRFCGKFGVTETLDSNNNVTKLVVRVPNWNNAFIEGCVAEEIGEEYRDGIPNIVATFPGTESYSDSSAARAAIKVFSKNTVIGASANNVMDNNAFVFDASLGTVYSGEYTRSDTDGVDGEWNVTLMSQAASPYGKSAKVRPNTVRCRWCIQIDPLTVKVDTSLLRDLQTQVNELKAIVQELQKK